MTFILYHSLRVSEEKGFCLFHMSIIFQSMMINDKFRQNVLFLMIWFGTI